MHLPNSRTITPPKQADSAHLDAPRRGRHVIEELSESVTSPNLETEIA